MNNDALERNLDQLVTRAHQPPRMSAEARARVLERIKRQRADQGAARRVGRRRWALAIGAVAAAAGVLGAIALRDEPAAVAVYEGGDAAPRVVRHGDAAELVLERGAVVRAVGARELVLVRGSVLVDVAPGRGEYLVRTPHGEVKVLGTRFVLDSAPDATSAAVVRGLVALSTPEGEVMLRAGELGVLRDGKPPMRQPAPRLTHLTSWAKQARRRAESEAVAPARRGTLLAREPEGWGSNREWPLPMRELTVDVHVEDQVARVALDQTFFNHVDRELEGVYQFPLPHDAAISRLAMYVDGKRMEAAIVERQRGRQVYESIVYRRRDPALLEWMQGNLFKVRIFPLRARSEKRIVLSYTQPLARLYDGYRLEVPIPELDEPVRRVRYRARLAGCQDCDVTSSSHALTVAREGDDTVVSFEAERYTIGDDLLLHVRPPRRDGVRVARHGDYWLAGVQPDLGSAPEHTRRSWVVLYDTSASRGGLELQAQAHFVDQLVQELDEEDELAVIAFDATTRGFGQGFTQIARTDRRALHEFLTREAADGVGHTDLDAGLRAALERLSGAQAAPHILYVGDGLATGGVRDLDDLRARVRGRATVVAVAVGDRLDARVLRALAGDTGGLFAAVNPGEDLSWRAFDLVATLNTARVLDLSAAWLDAAGKPLASDAYTGLRQLADGEELVAVGRFRDGAPAALRLAGIANGEAWSRTYALGDAAPRGDAGYLPRLWAQQRIDALLADGEVDHRDEITALGLRHFLITPFTSLLVLENDAMYAQYGVRRAREPGWAAYALPAEIPVVREPLAAASASAQADPRAAILRVPLPLLYEPQAQLWAQGLGNERWTRQTAFGPLRASGAIGGMIGGGGVGFGRLGTIGHGAGGLLAGELGGVLEVPSADEQAPTEASAVDVTTVVTTPEVRGQAGRDWTVAPAKLADDGDRSAAGGALVRGKLGGLKKAKRVAGWRGIGGGRRARSYHGYGYGYAPAPQLYTHDRDPHLDDLSELVPGLLASDYDAGWLELQRTAGSGSISDDARALVDRARAALEAQELSAEGETMVLGRDGRFTVERQTSSALRELVVYDGDALTTSYPELGLAVRRPVGAATPALYLSWAPFVVPPADHLARWYQVTARGDRTLVLTPPRGDELDAGSSFELALDEGYRVIALRTVVDGKAVDEVTVAYAPDRVTVRAGAAERVLQRRAASAPPAAPATSAEVVVQLPLRQPSYWQAELAEAAAGSEAWAFAQRQLLAAHAALADATGLWQTLDALRAHATVRRGDLVLASGARRVMPAAALRELRAAVGTDDPVGRYLAAGEVLHRTGSLAGFEALARDHEGTLVGMLSSYRALLRAIQSRGARRARAAFDAFVDRYDHGALRYVAANRFVAYFGWQHPRFTVAVWDRLADDPEWGYVARYEAARVLVNRGRYSEAAERFDALLRDTLAAGDEPRIDYAFRTAFVSGGRGQAGWRLVWSQWRARVVRDRDPRALLAFLDAAQAVGEWDDIDRVVAPFRGLEIDDPEVALALVDALTSMGRHDQAWGFLAPLVAEAARADDELLARAAAIAEQQGRLPDAARYLETLLARESPMTLTELRGAYARLIAIYGKLSYAPGAEGEGALARALAAAAGWRRQDPDNDQIDRASAGLLYAHGRAEEAWRHLSTAIERDPALGSAYERVATALENEGRLREADGQWRRAVEVEPTNPTWLLRRAQNLVALGDVDDALGLLERIDRGAWQARFSNVDWQAQQMRRQLSRGRR